VFQIRDFLTFKFTRFMESFWYIHTDLLSFSVLLHVEFFPERVFLQYVFTYCKKKKSFPATAIQATRWRAVKLLLILELGTRCEWSASRPSRALPPGKDPRYSLDRRLGRPQNRSVNRLQMTCRCQGSKPGRPVCNQTLY
jgi:hypothetical protein